MHACMHACMCVCVLVWVYTCASSQISTVAMCVQPTHVYGTSIFISIIVLLCYCNIVLCIIVCCIIHGTGLYWARMIELLFFYHY